MLATIIWNVNYSALCQLLIVLALKRIAHVIAIVKSVSNIIKQRMNGRFVQGKQNWISWSSTKLISLISKRFQRL
jgi:hypothetical protein